MAVTLEVMIILVIHIHFIYYELFVRMWVSQENIFDIVNEVMQWVI